MCDGNCGAAPTRTSRSARLQLVGALPACKNMSRRHHGATLILGGRGALSFVSDCVRLLAGLVGSAGQPWRPPQEAAWLVSGRLFGAAKHPVYDDVWGTLGGSPSVEPCSRRTVAKSGLAVTSRVIPGHPSCGAAMLVFCGTVHVGACCRRGVSEGVQGSRR